MPCMLSCTAMIMLLVCVICTVLNELMLGYKNYPQKSMHVRSETTFCSVTPKICGQREPNVRRYNGVIFHIVIFSHIVIYSDI